MNFTIALNTIIYIMVFLFPGVLFRKTYFSGKYSKQFGQGNLLERFLWTLFCSIMTLIVFGLFIYWLSTFCGYALIHDLDFITFSNVFKGLASNKYPEELTNQDCVLQLGILLLSIYFFSLVLGWFCVQIVKVFSFDLRVSALRFNNEWLYLSTATKENGIKIGFGDVYATYVDVMCHHKDNVELYRGLYKNFFFDKENKLENVVLSNAERFIQIYKEPENQVKIDGIMDLIRNQDKGYIIHKEYTDKIIFKKIIDGHILALSSQNISNINLTYVKLSNKIMVWKLQILRVLKFVMFIGILLLLAIPFVNDNRIPIDGILKRSLFTVLGTITLLAFYSIIKSLLIIHNKSLFTIYESLIFLGIFIAPYLWIFDAVSGVSAVIIYIVINIFGGYCLGLVNKRRKEENTANLETADNGEA